jgi:glycosyltransferase involved in cell wall biosynthesis
MQSLLAPAVIEARVIPNGIDLTIFKPGNQVGARERLDIPLDAKVILFAANGIKRNIFKDYATIQSAITLLSKSMTFPTIVIALGEEGVTEQLGHVQIRYIPPVSNRELVAAYYQSADVYVHASHADTFPTSIIEAMACGIPVVATAVGGIPEQVVDGQTGILVAQGDGNAMASAIEKILANPALQKQMGDAGAQIAKEKYSQELQAKRYLDWYQEILSAAKDPA